MKPFYSISIPKPCHENWNSMTANEKGRFCNSCAKTVVDFTQMNTQEIQGFLYENRNNRICGHIRQEQLDAINIQIPYESFSSEMNFNRLFLLALLIVMGTTLLNCTNTNNKIQKIESVEIVDAKEQNLNVKIDKTSLQNKDSSGVISDTIKKNEERIQKSSTIKIKTEVTTVNGDMVLESIKPEPPIPEESFLIGMVVNSNPPSFKDTPQNLSVRERRDFLSKRIEEFFGNEFKTDQRTHPGLKGTQKFQIMFKIDETGMIKNIRVKSSHPTLDKEAERVLNLLPQFIPAKQNGKNVSVVYNLPIVFQVEE